MILKNVTEYFEGYDVEIRELIVNYDTSEKKLCIYAQNEGGFNSVGIDAKQLYEALKEYFEGNNKNA